MSVSALFSESSYFLELLICLQRCAFILIADKIVTKFGGGRPIIKIEHALFLSKKNGGGKKRGRTTKDDKARKNKNHGWLLATSTQALCTHEGAIEDAAIG
jgi:hypothetical protein